MSKQQTASPDFESALNELESIVHKMEQGDLTLENSLAAFERGIELSRFCQQSLTQAKQKVDQLTSVDSEGRPTFAPFEDNEHSDA